MGKRNLVLAAILGTSGLLLTIASLLLIVFVTGPALKSELRKDLKGAATQLAEKLDQRMFERWQDIKLAAGRQALRSRGGDGPEREVVEEIKAGDSRYAWIGFTDENCIVRVSTEASIDGTNVETRPWCAEARKGPFVGDVHEAVLLKSRLKDIGRIGLLMDIAVPVRSPEKAVSGVLAAHLVADWLIDVNESMRDASPIETMIITSQRQVIVGPTGLMGKTLDEASFARLHDNGWQDGAYLSHAVTTKGMDDFPGFGWTAVARVSRDEANALERKLLFWTALAGLIVSAIMALIGFTVAHRLARPQSLEPEQRRPVVPISQ